jgi:hypothetical protein
MADRQSFPDDANALPLGPSPGPGVNLRRTMPGPLLVAHVGFPAFMANELSVIGPVPIRPHHHTQAWHIVERISEIGRNLCAGHDLSESCAGPAGYRYRCDSLMQPAIGG